MSKTLAQIRTLTRTLLSEPSPSYWSDSELNTYINDGLADFCFKTDVLEDISTDSLVQYQADYTLPSDYTKIKHVELIKGNSIYMLGTEDLDEHYTGTVKSTSNPPDGYNIWEGKLRVRERPGTAAQATTLNGSITASDISIALTSSAGLPRAGRIVIESEVIIYWGISTNTLTPCERGAEGTTAATHSSAVAATLRDIWIYHYKKDNLATDLIATVLPSQFDNAPAYFAAAVGRRKSKDHDLAREYQAIYDGFVGAALDWSKSKWRRKWTPK